MTESNQFILSCRTARASDDRMFELHPGGALNRGFTEFTHVSIAAPAGEGWALLIDDAVLERGGDGTWTWSPGFYAGLVSADLQRQGRTVARYVLDVSPDPAKLGIDTYGQLIKELRHADPTLIAGTEPAESQVGALGADQDPWVEFRRLRMYGPPFIAALNRLIRRPLMSQRMIRRMVPLREARHADLRTVLAAAANGTADAFSGSSDVSQVALLRREPLYDIPSVQEHLDGTANRCITALLVSVARRTRNLRKRLELEVERVQGSETRTDLKARWPARREFLDVLSRNLGVLLTRDPFKSVTRPEITAAGLNAIAAHPEYAQAYGAGWRAIRAGLRHIDPTETIWLRPTWELYERWCFIRILQLIRERADGCMVANRHGSLRTWRGHTASGTEILVFLQPRFPAFDNTSRNDFWSISREREPDIVIAVSTHDLHRFVVLDAKYRQCRTSVLDSMASAHIYHDSLRWGNRSPDSALLLVPAGGGAPWLEHSEVIDEHGLGVIPFAPEKTIDQLTLQFHRLLAFE